MFKTKVVSVRFPLKTYQKMAHRAEQLGVSISRVVLDACLDEHPKLTLLEERVTNLDQKLAKALGVLLKASISQQDPEFSPLQHQLQQALGGAS